MAQQQQQQCKNCLMLTIETSGKSNRHRYLNFSHISYTSLVMTLISFYLLGKKFIQ